MFDSAPPTPKASAPSRPPHPAFELGTASALENPSLRGKLRVPPHHFVTHGVVVGMTGSGKTGLVTVLAE